MTHVTLVPNDLMCGLQDPSSPTLRFLRLPHPRTGAVSLFLPLSSIALSSPANPASPILEVQAVAPHSCRSWFLDEGQVVADGKLLLMTPVDPIFLLLPILQASLPVDGSLGNFRQSDDIFEEAAARLSGTPGGSKSVPVRNGDVMTLAALDCIPEALRRVCDVKDLTEDLSVYRFSRCVFLETLRAKVAHLSQSETFDTFPSLYRRLARDGLSDGCNEELRQAGRIRASCETLSQYLPPDLLNDLIASYDFTALDAHMQRLVEEEESNNKPPPVQVTSVLQETRSDKKRKATSQLSKGVSKLLKANTSGMAKISSFFKKPTK